MDVFRLSSSSSHSEIRSRTNPIAFLLLMWPSSCKVRIKPARVVVSTTSIGIDDMLHIIIAARPRK
ncbi:hypothetical protein M378DRAFT_171334 [Amanita muscaria Koide BX008]|uniref:Uncharacterized protein n=1 Tax=Amanita muscaria (strain Koide BX008) TaxID=946122 RepID=A0A0C2WM69_AMAMK|nr:hypothetical protein M378DRAFT_171334 [Amanita muscaria Koide BX008]